MKQCISLNVGKRLILLGFIIPIFVAVVTTLIPSPIPNLETSNDWIGFFGSYMGAILGGFITLIVMEKTIESGNQNLKVSIEENKKIELRREKREFCNDITTLIADYCSKIKEYRYAAENMQRLAKDYKESSGEFILKKSKLAKESIKNTKGIEKNKLESDKFELDLCKIRYEDDKIKFNKSLEYIDSINLAPLYYELNIKLKGVEESELLLKKIKEINNSKGLNLISDNLEDAKKYNDKFNDAIDDLMEECTYFIERYIEKEL